MNQNILPLIQDHTRKIYGLDQKTFTVRHVPARDLLDISRFDLFAKLYYIRNRKSNPELALRVYAEHIKAFNPDLKEPGRDDKCGMDQFVRTFDSLIDHFATAEFDDSVSVVPVDKNGIILDGAHRVSVLAYYGKEVTIVQFDDVVSKGVFNYNYFLTRGLSIEIADLVALEATQWCENLYAACIWPKISRTKGRNLVKDIIRSRHEVLYEKTLYTSLTPLTRFMTKVYENQDWVGTRENNFMGARAKASNCYSMGNRVDVVLFRSTLPLEEIVRMKEEIRGHFSYGKHTVHITDNDTETRYISGLVLDKSRRSSWLQESDWLSRNSIYERIREWGILFRYCYYLRFKELVYRLVHCRFSLTSI